MKINILRSLTQLPSAPRVVNSTLLLTGVRYVVQGPFLLADGPNFSRITHKVMTPTSHFAEIMLESGEQPMLIALSPCVVYGRGTTRSVTLNTNVVVRTPDTTVLMNEAAANAFGNAPNPLTALGNYQWGAWDDRGKPLMNAQLMCGPLLQQNLNYPAPVGPPAPNPILGTPAAVGSYVAPAWTRVRAPAFFPCDEELHNIYITGGGVALPVVSRRYMVGFGYTPTYRGVGWHVTIHPAPITVQTPNAYAGPTVYTVDQYTSYFCIGRCANTFNRGLINGSGVVDAVSDPLTYQNMLYVGPIQWTASRAYSFFIQDGGATTAYNQQSAIGGPNDTIGILENDAAVMNTFLTGVISLLPLTRLVVGISLPAWTNAVAATTVATAWRVQITPAEQPALDESHRGHSITGVTGNS